MSISRFGSRDDPVLQFLLDSNLDSISSLQGASDPDLNTDFFTDYMRYAGTGVNEPPAIFHRWSCYSMIGALLGRQAYYPFGHGLIYPNNYIMIMGAPGARKNTAINIGKKLVGLAGYSRFADDKCSKEQFILNMQQFDKNDLLDAAELEMLTFDEPSEVYVVAPEFTDFIGMNNMEYVTLLTNLWDNLEEYKSSKIHSKSVVVQRPTVNIIGGNTVQGFALAFPAEALGNGFLSRVIFVHGDATGRKVTFPAKADLDLESKLVDHLKEIKRKVVGEFTMDAQVMDFVDRIYQDAVPVDDPRFIHYSGRRLTHLFKASMILAASDLTTVIQVKHVLRANTMLAFAERKMPKALGEFGKSKYSDISNQIIDHLTRATRPVSINMLWKVVSKDLTRQMELHDILKNLMTAERIQQVSIMGVQGFLANHIQGAEWNEDFICPEWLTNEELM